MLSVLPPEVILHIFSFVPVYHVPALRRLSASWRDFLDLHENTIYRSAAILHSIALPGSSLDDSKGSHVLPWLDDVDDWKNLCKKYITLEKAWTGKGNTTQKTVVAEGPFHSFKVDEEQRTVICANRDGGLQVMCALENTVLWSLPRSYTSPYTNLEYSHGFIVFNRGAMYLEVWQRETDREAPGLSPSPDAAQLKVWRRSPDLSAARGRYRPFAVLPNPGGARTCRLAYPHLLAVSQAGTTAYIWHIPTVTLVQTLTLMIPWDSARSIIYYVEVSDDHAFFCFSIGLVVYSRQTGAIVFQVPGYEPSNLFDRAALRLEKTLSRPIRTTSRLKSHSLAPMVSKEATVRLLSSGFIAVHVSPSGRDLVAVSHLGLLFYVPDFAEASNLEDRVHTMVLGSKARHMAYDGKRIVVCIETGVYCITLNSLSPTSVPLLPPVPAAHSFPSPSVQRVAFFAYGVSDRVSCLQLTSTSLWLTWPGDDTYSNIRNIRYVDFTQATDPVTDIGSRD